jgi:hypothetical protein
MNPKYPIYIISKGRSESRLTVRSLELINVPFRVVIEPQEYDKYAAVIDPKKLIVTPFSNLGLGSIPVRNFVWEHSINEGHKRHWVVDDNIAHFYRINKNLKIRVNDGTIFRCCEDFSDRFENVKMSGMNYAFFCPAGEYRPPYYLNTRVYSCILLDNSLDLRWRGRLNEDTDLSIRIMKEGFCTILFNAFTCGKAATLTMKGGNTDELYKAAGDNRLSFAQSLQAQHPDVVQIIKRWGRWHHLVDYTVFEKNHLILKNDLNIPKGINEYGMVLKKMQPKIDAQLETEELIQQENE